MSMKVPLQELLGLDEKPTLSPDNIAFKAALDFEAEVFRKLKEKDLSQKDLAEILAVSPAAVSKALKKGSNVTLKTMAKIAHALDCVLSPIQLKDVDECNYFDISNSETVSASIELGKISQPKSRIAG